MYSMVDVFDTERFWNETMLTLNKTAISGAGHLANWTPDAKDSALTASFGSHTKISSHFSLTFSSAKFRFFMGRDTFDQSTNIEVDAGTYELLPRIEAVANSEASLATLPTRHPVKKQQPSLYQTKAPVFAPTTSSRMPYIDPELAAIKDRRGLNLKEWR
ncbi:3343_t:CDS:2 [Ambispora gerdemannii]|uniref:3343_t:CDS:1 n=1 Tax=Ambispora gerdemannii TaxID=144530 RepID=A0A9N8YM25_9GLOM|nr:3343_t:CDS:2 [Ambispora gerdemannii]